MCVVGCGRESRALHLPPCCEALYCRFLASTDRSLNHSQVLEWLSVDLGRRRTQPKLPVPQAAAGEPDAPSSGESTLSPLLASTGRHLNHSRVLNG